MFNLTSSYSALNIYKILRPILFLIDAEKAHTLAINLLRWHLNPRFNAPKQSILQTCLKTSVGDLSFPNPLGLAAGFDKQAEVIGPVFNFGFGFVELGSITPLPQPGNPRPRLFRVEECGAVINRFGFNSDGIEKCRKRIARYLKSSRRSADGILGVNLGKNKENPDAAADYTTGVKAFSDLADYLTINISSPNTPGLRELQRREPLEALIARVMKERDSSIKPKPLFVKVAPDLCDEQIDDICEIALKYKVDGIIVSNTTIMRPHSLPEKIAAQSGGLSGKPLFEISLKVLREFYKRTNGQILLIGCGGISNGQDAYKMICAGASLIQIYTVLIYEGPSVVIRILNELRDILEREGYSNIKQAVGKHPTG